MTDKYRQLSRRMAVFGGAALLSGCASGSFRYAPLATNVSPEPPRPKMDPPEIDWNQFFADLTNGAVLVNIDDRWLAYWPPGSVGYYEAFPIAVPLNPDLTKTGLTKIVRRRENPSWRPTPDMRRRMPGLPEYIGPGPDNPLGERALYLSWTYYAIHGTNDPQSIGTQATSGCFRMHPDDILWLYERAEIGIPVRVIQNMADVPTDLT